MDLSSSASFLLVHYFSIPIFLRNALPFEAFVFRMSRWARQVALTETSSSAIGSNEFNGIRLLRPFTITPAKPLPSRSDPACAAKGAARVARGLRSQNVIPSNLLTARAVLRLWPGQFAAHGTTPQHRWFRKICLPYVAPRLHIRPLSLASQRPSRSYPAGDRGYAQSAAAA